MKKKIMFLTVLAAMVIFVGATAALAEEGHSHEGWTAWTETASLPTSSGSYYLTEDVELTDEWNVTGGRNITLCLNGHDITQTTSGKRVIIVQGTDTVLSLYDCTDDPGHITGGSVAAPGSGIRVHGTSTTLNLDGVVVTGNTVQDSATSYYGGGIAVTATTGTVNITNTQIIGNEAPAGGGIAVWSGSSKVYLNDGTVITGNRATGTDESNTNHRGGAGALSNVNQSITVSGTVIITGNTQGSAASNFTAAYDRTLICSSLSKESRIGVGAYPANYSSLVTNVTAENLGVFEADAPGKAVRLNSNSLLTLIDDSAHAGNYGYTAGGHGSVSWTAWESSSTLPTDDGNYYLTKDITVNSTTVLAENKSITICLNGHTITQGKEGARILNVNKNDTVHICDCTAVVRGDGTYEAGAICNGHAGDAEAGAIRVNGGSLHLHDGILRNNSTNTFGGALYVTGGGTFVMNGGLIRDNESKDRGGAIFNNANVTINGGEIVNNTASTAGGGIYVHYNGTLDVDGGFIGNNTSAKGKEIYLNFNDTNRLFATANIASAAFIDTSTDDPIWSQGFASINGIITVSSPVYQERTAAEFYSMGGFVTDTVTARLGVRIAPKSGDEVSLTYMNGAIQSTAALIDQNNSLYYFDATVNVNRIASPLELVLKSGSATINTYDYSVLDYFNALAAAEGTTAAQKTFMADMITYAGLLQGYAASNDYPNPGAEFTAENWVSECRTADDDFAVNDKKTIVNAVDGTLDKVRSAKLAISDKISLRFSLIRQAASTVEVKKGETVLAEGTDYTLSADQINIARLSPADYSSVYTVTIKSGEETLHAITYSVNSYCTGKKNDTEIGELARAIYRYGQSAISVLGN